MARILDETVRTLLGDVEPRNDLEHGTLPLRDEEGEALPLREPDARSSLATACLLLCKLAERGGTRASLETLRAMKDELVRPLREIERAAIRREVARVLLWLWEVLGSEEIDGEAVGAELEGLEGQDEEERTGVILDRAYPVGDKPELIRRAIAEGDDLIVDYYTFHRGQLTWRRVTPIEMRKDGSFIGYCHEEARRLAFQICKIRSLHRIKAT